MLRPGEQCEKPRRPDGIVLKNLTYRPQEHAGTTNGLQKDTKTTTNWWTQVTETKTHGNPQ